MVSRPNPLRFIGKQLSRIPPMPALMKWYKKTPFGLNTPKTWTRPSEDEYELALHYDGFISKQHWKDDDLSQYPAILQDLDDLDEYLMEVFWEYNQRSRYYQRKYYYYQWVFIIGAFLTTAMGVLTTYFAGDNVSFLGAITTSVRLLWWDTGWTMVGLFSVSTTIVSTITSYFTLLSNQGEPRKRWASYRRLAEELRMLYFKFISRLEPFDKADRVQILRKRILEIKELEPTSAS